MSEGISCQPCKPAITDRMRWKIQSIKGWITQKVQNICFRILHSTVDSNYIKHAEREFNALGWPGGDEMQGWVCDNLRDLLMVFATQGHSGSSAPYVINCFQKLAKFEPLGPITGADSEWNSGCTIGGGFQNNRLSSVFKEAKDSPPYYIDAVVFREENGSCFTGSGVKLASGEIIKSRQFIKLPFTPKTFYIDVISTEVAPDDWEHSVKDESQLDEVFEHYIKIPEV